MYPATYQPQYDPMQVIRIFFYGTVLGIVLTLLFFVKFPNILPAESSASNGRLGVIHQDSPAQPEEEKQSPLPHKSDMTTILVERQTNGQTNRYSNVASPVVSPALSPALSPVDDVGLYATVVEALAIRNRPTVEGTYLRRLQLNERVKVVQVSNNYEIIKLHNDDSFGVGGRWYKVVTVKDNLEGWVFEVAFKERFK
jgi:Bacterial SH3 domain